MKIIRSKNKLIKFIKNEKNLGFVPTMGSLHLGHISLINKSIKECKKTLVSIYVNKSQFNKKSDFITYPRNIKKDINLIKKLEIDYLFLPKDKEIYPNKVKSNIKIHPFAKRLCGKNRPGHFKAVVDVVDRFIKAINPKNIYLGEKDMQQLLIVKDFVKKKYKKINIISCKTIREKNGIAYSSRNKLLNKKEKEVASKIYSFLKKNKIDLIKKKISLMSLKKIIFSLSVKKIDYVQVLNINKIIKPYINKKRYKVFISYYLGSTRLIDNI